MFLPDGRSGPVLVDESFIDFTNLGSSIAQGDIVLRSLTKIHALPGLRVGAVTGPGELIRRWREQREPWQLNVMAEAAVLVSLSDPEYVKRTREYVAAERTRLWPLLAQLPGVNAIPACANFYFVKLRYPASTFCAYMLERKILLRNCTGWIGVEGEAVRFAIRTTEENDRLMELWRNFDCES